jgi:rubrerythrin
MKLNTASQVISLARQLEEDGAAFYESLAGQYVKVSEVLLGFSRENKKNIMRVERAYFGGITDALEGTFTFDIDPEEYTVKTGGIPDAGFPAAINTAIEMERKTARFYDRAAEQSKTLLADVPRAFITMGKLRDERCQKLEEMRSSG